MNRGSKQEPIHVRDSDDDRKGATRKQVPPKCQSKSGGAKKKQKQQQQQHNCKEDNGESSRVQRKACRNRKNLRNQVTESDREIFQYQLNVYNRQIENLEEQVRTAKSSIRDDKSVQLDPPPVPDMRDKMTQLHSKNFLKAKRKRALSLLATANTLGEVIADLFGESIKMPKLTIQMVDDERVRSALIRINTIVKAYQLREKLEKAKLEGGGSKSADTQESADDNSRSSSAGSANANENVVTSRNQPDIDGASDSSASNKVLPKKENLNSSPDLSKKMSPERPTAPKPKIKVRSFSKDLQCPKLTQASASQAPKPPTNIANTRTSSNPPNTDDTEKSPNAVVGRPSRNRTPRSKENPIFYANENVVTSRNQPDIDGASDSSASNKVLPKKENLNSSPDLSKKMSPKRPTAPKPKIKVRSFSKDLQCPKLTQASASQAPKPPTNIANTRTSRNPPNTDDTEKSPNAVVGRPSRNRTPRSKENPIIKEVQRKK